LVILLGTIDPLDARFVMQEYEASARVLVAQNRSVVVAQGKLDGGVLKRVIETVTRLESELGQAPLLVLSLAPPAEDFASQSAASTAQECEDTWTLACAAGTSSSPARPV
jgi:hypothetical protein